MGGGAGPERAAVLDLLGQAGWPPGEPRPFPLPGPMGSIPVVPPPRGGTGRDRRRLVIDRAGAGAVVVAPRRRERLAGPGVELRAAGLVVHPGGPLPVGCSDRPTGRRPICRCRPDELVRKLCTGALDAIAFTSPTGGGRAVRGGGPPSASRRPCGTRCRFRWIRRWCLWRAIGSGHGRSPGSSGGGRGGLPAPAPSRALASALARGRRSRSSTSGPPSRCMLESERPVG